MAEVQVVLKKAGGVSVGDDVLEALAYAAWRAEEKELTLSSG